MLRPPMCIALTLLLGCSAPSEEGVNPARPVQSAARAAHAIDATSVSDASMATRAIEPLPIRSDVDAKKAALGERLFSDPRLSGDQRVACSSCHALTTGGAHPERRPQLPGRKRPVSVNVPTIFNVAFDFRYAWDGRFKTLEEQIEFAMHSDAAMAGSFGAACARLQGDPPLARAFAQAYAQGLTAETLRDALVAYCRSAITPNSRFDRFLRGGLRLSEEELRGYEAFRDYGCISCHQGVNVGGNMFQRFGVMRPYFTEARPAKPEDLGRFNTTHDERDRFVFRVPSLRNVALTAPYFHDGSAATLEEAITVMARYQLGRELTDEQTRAIAAFLRTLTGEYRGTAL